MCLTACRRLSLSVRVMQSLLLPVGTSVVVAVGRRLAWPVAGSARSRSVLVAGCRAVGTRSDESVPQSCSVGCASALPCYFCAHSNGTHSTFSQGIGRQSMSAQSRQQTAGWRCCSPPVVRCRGPSETTPFWSLVLRVCRSIKNSTLPLKSSSLSSILADFIWREFIWIFVHEDLVIPMILVVDFESSMRTIDVILQLILLGTYDDGPRTLAAPHRSIKIHLLFLPVTFLLKMNIGLLISLPFSCNGQHHGRDSVFQHACFVTANDWFKLYVHKQQFCIETVPSSFQHSLAAFDSAPC